MRLFSFAVLILVLPITVHAEPEIKTDSWTVPSPLDIRRELELWLKTENVTDPPKRDEILSQWPETDIAVGGGRLLFEKTIDSMRQASAPVAGYLAACDALAWRELPFGQPLALPQIPLQVYLSESGPSKYLLGSLRYYLARCLIQARFYDEAGLILDGMKPDNSIDPAGVLLARAIVCNRLADKEKGLAAVRAFRDVAEEDASIPRRQTELAKLIEFDLKQQRKEDDPENIARKMDDVRRRLGKGRTDDDTQKAEDGVLKSLDQLIEKIERQCKKQGEGGDSDRGGQGNKPADDSRLLKQKGPGNVDRREFDPDGNWGDLPPKQREEALLRIEKEFPSFYRDIIEQYFRETAASQEAAE